MGSSGWSLRTPVRPEILSFMAALTDNLCPGAMSTDGVSLVIMGYFNTNSLGLRVIGFVGENFLGW